METVVWVDDDPDLLLLMRRWLGSDYDLHTFDDSRSAFVELKSLSVEPVVVVADMNMPGMDGATFLSHVAEFQPNAVRVMFTGADDQQTAQKAVNEGHVFRFLTKGSDLQVIRETVDAAVHEFRSRETERRVLEDTTIGAVRALMDILAITQPSAFGRATRIRQTVAAMAEALSIRSWQVELGASLSQLGCIVLPPLVMERVAQGRDVAPIYEKMFVEHPRTGAELIRKIPRLQPIADIVLFQHKYFSGAGFPEGGRAGASIPLGARMLKVAIDYDRLVISGSDPPAALTRMRARDGWYDPELLVGLAASTAGSESLRPTTLSPSELRPGMILAEDVRTADGLVVATRGEQVTNALALRLAANPNVRRRLAVLAA
ncbi:MAG: HD domain-containing phosphohydrolase [Dehalococcoidia bacterium]